MTRYAPKPWQVLAGALAPTVITVETALLRRGVLAVGRPERTGGNPAPGSKRLG
jgi:hypothetical protein